MKKTPQEIYEEVVTAVHAALKPLGYAKSGTTFRRIGPETTLIVNLQKSKYTTRDNVSFTMNCAIFINDMSDARGLPPNLRRISQGDAQVCARIGFLLDTPGGDKWWEIECTTEAASLVSEILAALREAGLPFLERYSTKAAIVAAWRQGNCLWQSELTRQRYLNIVDMAEGRPPTYQEPDPATDRAVMIAAWRSGNYLGYSESFVRKILAGIDAKESAKQSDPQPPSS